MTVDLLRAHPRTKDLSGNVFGQLTVVCFEKLGPSNDAMWRCLCACGKEYVVLGASLTRGVTKSCGCQTHKKGSLAHAFKHGESSFYQCSRLYSAWANMKARCSNHNNPFFKHYGGRGISVCSEWKNYEAFRDWAINNGYAQNLTIDRINPDRNYEPSNCQWITIEENARRANEFNRIHKRGVFAK